MPTTPVCQQIRQMSTGSLHVDRDLDLQHSNSYLVNLHYKSTNRTRPQLANTPNRIPLRQISPVLSRNNTYYSHYSPNLSPVTPIFHSGNSKSNVSDLTTIESIHDYSSTRNGNIVTNCHSTKSVQGRSCITTSTTAKAKLKSPSITLTTAKYVPDYPIRPGFPKKRRMDLDSIPRFDLSLAEND